MPEIDTCYGVPVVIIEDDPGLARLIQLNLQHIGLTAHIAENGTQAVKVVQECAGECLLLVDYQLPDMTGQEVIELLQTQQLKPAFIVMTGHGDERIAVEMMKLGARDYVVKDGDFLQLLPTVVNRTLHDLYTDRRLIQAEEALKKSEKRYRGIVENLPIMLYRLDPKTYRLTFINKAYATFLGHSDTALVGAYLPDLIPSQERERVLSHLEKLQREHAITVYEHPISTPQGDRWLRWMNQALYDDPHHIVELQCIGEDITERKRAEEALAEEKELLAITLRSIGDGVITTDIDGNVLMLNAIAEELTGWTQAEATSRALSEVFHIVSETTHQVTENPVMEAIKHGNITGMRDYTTLISRQGREIPITTNTAPIRDRWGNIKGGVVVFRDVTEAKKLRQAKVNFLNAVTHELRTPLTPIIGYAQLMLSLPEVTPEMADFLNAILKAANREKKLIEELLAIARLESGTEHYHFQTINAYQLFSEICDDGCKLVEFMVQERYHTTCFQFESTISKELRHITLKVDVNRIQQVVENLLTNAVKYSNPERLSIHFMARVEDKQVIVSVQDQGIGIPPQEQKQIFEPFYQIRFDELDVSDGIGQGLPLVKKYVEVHGGTITVNSIVGEGSTFQFTLPVIVQATEASRAGLSRPRDVILIEDDEQIATFLQILLEESAFRVSLFKEGRSGLEALKTASPDLIILDLQLPDIDGGEIIDFLERERPHTPLLLCSAQPLEVLETIQRQSSLTMDFIVKPFNINELIDKIEALLPD
ncbi:MAG: hybrid sensor histidine kinase/response regulator [Gemmatimonadetes bacterium]|nr:MAG: hybrid sensor histidine kinase/response regulator [Gemmatimonadota bacterium]